MLFLYLFELPGAVLLDRSTKRPAAATRELKVHFLHKMNNKS